MSEQDKQMLDMLLKDKGERYRVVIDNDSVWVEDKESENKSMHSFQEYGYYLLQQILQCLGLDAELC